MVFLKYWSEHKENQIVKKLEDILGLRWSKDDFVHIPNVDGKRPENLKFRLSEVLNPELRKTVKEMLGLG